jgi:hypothetical protein
MKIFHPTYTCIIHVLNAKHMCAKCTNPQKKNFCTISITKLWDCKLVINVFHMKHCDLSQPLQHPFACICKLNANVYQHYKLGNDLLHGSSTTIKLDTYVPRSWVSWRLEELHFNVQNAMKGNIAKILWVINKPWRCASKVK